MTTETLRQSAAANPATLAAALATSLSALFFFATWTNAFTLGPILPLPILALGVSAALYLSIVIGGEGKLRFSLELHDLFFLGFLAWTILAAVIAPNIKTKGYLIAYGLSFGLMAILLRSIMLQANATKRLLNANAAGIVVVSLFCIAEFIGRYHLAINLQDAIPRGVAATAVYFNFPRVYGFAEEPTYLCWHLNTLGSIAVYWVWREGRGGLLSKALYTMVVATAWVFTFSAAGYVFLLVGFCAAVVATILRDGLPAWMSRLRTTKFWLPIVLSLVLTIASVGLLARSYGPGPALFARDLERRWAATPTAISLSDSYERAMARWRRELPAALRDDLEHAGSTQEGFHVGQCAREVPLSMQNSVCASGSLGLGDGLFQKLSLTERHGTPRILRWKQHLTWAEQKPLFGWGPGYFSSIRQGSSLNLYLFAAVEQGFPAAVLLLLGFGFAAWRIARSGAPYAGVFLMATVAGILHLLTMTQHYHPAIWLTLAAFFALESERSQQSTSWNVQWSRWRDTIARLLPRPSEDLAR